MRKRLSKILWHGDDIDNQGLAIAPPLADGDNLSGINRGELFISDNPLDPALFIRLSNNEIIAFRPNGNGEGSGHSLWAMVDADGNEVQNDGDAIAVMPRFKQLGVASETFVTGYGLYGGGSGGGSTIILDNLTSTSKDAALSANMGRELKELIDSKTITLTADSIRTALGYTPFKSDDFTKANIKTTLGISDWALKSSLEFADMPTMYWANVEVSSSSSTEKEPTFAKVKIGQATLSYDSATGVLLSDKPFASLSEVSAHGIGSTGGGGSVVIIDNLASESAEAALSANMGRYLKSLIDGKASSWDDITGKPTWIGDSKPSYAFSEIGSKPTTISGYGITDAITISDIGEQSVLYAHATRDKDHHDYTTRYTTANNVFADGALHYYLATSSMTTAKPLQGDSHILHLSWDNSTWESQLAVKNSGKGMQTRTQTTNGWTDWQTVAYIDDNVASATKLQTTRTLWGRSFNGTANVSGDLFNATALCATDNYTAAAYLWSDGTNNHPWYGIHQRVSDYGIFSTTITNFYGMQLRTRMDGVGYISFATNYLLPNADNSVIFGSNNFMWKYGYFGWVGSRGGSNFSLGANSSTHMTIDTSGNIGVGTTTPAYKHDVNGDAYVRGWSRTDNGLYIENMGVHYTYQNQKDYECPLIYISKNNVLQFSVGNSTWTNMYVNYYSPRYGYTPTKWIWRAGSSTSHADFEVGQLTATTSTSGIIKLKRKTSGGAYIHYYHANSDADFWETGINTSNNFVWYWKGSTTAAYITSGGNFVATGESAAYSDRRLKSDIKDLDFRGALQPKSFVKDGKQCIGFIAQEVRELYPELVLGEETEDSYLSLNYGAITAVLACQTNDHEKRIAYLEYRVRELENENERLKAS